MRDCGSRTEADPHPASDERQRSFGDFLLRRVVRIGHRIT
jgi:hypothetical protein